MHHIANNAPQENELSDDIMTIREAAKRLGLAHTTLSRQIKQGKIKRRPDGLVSLREVIRGRKANLYWRPGHPDPAAGLLDPRLVHAAWRNHQGTEGRDEVWREHWSLFAAQHAPAIAAEFKIDASALHRSLLLHVYSHVAAILPGYRDPLSDDPWPDAVPTERRRSLRSARAS